MKAWTIVSVSVYERQVLQIFATCCSNVLFWSNIMPIFLADTEGCMHLRVIFKGVLYVYGCVCVVHVYMCACTMYVCVCVAFRCGTG